MAEILKWEDCRAYQGTEPDIFVSYAHKDSERVLPIIAKMQTGIGCGLTRGTFPHRIGQRLLRIGSAL